jgi:xylulose-5-phosphate/fructose-6-phosphate phosphoketolase
VVVAGKQPAPQWLSMDAACAHATTGIGRWGWASTDQSGEPDIVLACCGDVPTMEALAAAELLRTQLPDLKVRVVNVLDLMKLQPPEFHPHGLTNEAFDDLFTVNRPILFNFHGYPWLIHRLTYRRRGHANLHVRGYIEEGTTTTPFDMCVLNGIDRFHLVLDVIRRVPGLADRAEPTKRVMEERLAAHKDYICRHGEDLPEVRDWHWAEDRRLE